MTEVESIRIRPRRVRVVAVVAAIAVVTVFTVVGLALHGKVGAGREVFGTADQVAMILLGVLGGLAILMLARPRVDADVHGVRVRNIVGGYELPWQVVRAVRFDRGAPWASLDLADDDTVALMAVQAADKEHAVRAVRALRALLAAHRSGYGASAGG